MIANSVAAGIALPFCWLLSCYMPRLLGLCPLDTRLHCTWKGGKSTHHSTWAVYHPTVPIWPHCIRRNATAAIPEPGHLGAWGSLHRYTMQSVFTDACAPLSNQERVHVKGHVHSLTSDESTVATPRHRGTAVKDRSQR